MPDMVLQKAKPGLYVSELIKDRYQILESEFFPCHYYVYDLILEDIPFRGNDNSVMLFSSVKSAMNRIDGVKEVKQKASHPNKTPMKKGRTRGESALSYMKELLTTRGMELNNEAISKMIKERFPDSNYGPPMVKFNRKKLGLA